MERNSPNCFGFSFSYTNWPFSIFESDFYWKMSLEPTMDNSMFFPDSPVSGGLNKIVLSVVGWYVYVEIAPINCVSPTQTWAG